MGNDYSHENSKAQDDIFVSLNLLHPPLRALIVSDKSRLTYMHNNKTSVLDHFPGSSSFNLLEGHSRATMLLIVNNAAQGILSSFFFKYAGECFGLKVRKSLYFRFSVY